MNNTPDEPAPNATNSAGPPEPASDQVGPTPIHHETLLSNPGPQLQPPDGCS
jgi:hypothetical protein